MNVPTVADGVGVVPTSLALTAVGSTPNGSSATLAYAAGAYTLTMQPTDGTNPGIENTMQPGTFAGPQCVLKACTEIAGDSSAP